MNEDQINELKRHLKAEGITQDALADMFDVSQANINALLNGRTPFGKGVASLWEEKLGVRAAWLMIGDGEMLKPTIIRQENAHVEGHHGGIGQVTGGYVDIQNHHDEGKDKVIETQERQVMNMFAALVEELKGFHEVSARRDDRIKDQDTYIAGIIKSSYLRNESNMERMDELIRQQNEDRKNMCKLIEILDRNSERTQARADKLIELLIKKMK